MVGGAVRDKLLGLKEGDRDFVVVGATIQEMIEAGFKAVGKAFPVFIHPHSGEEYALARTEKKSGKGYKGFTFYTDKQVSLQQDLYRRDLTINAMAMDSNGGVMDYFGGIDDLQHKVLRHTSPCFSEDGVRLLRVARFAAALPHFSIHSSTYHLLCQMVQAGEILHLQPERIWREMARGLVAKQPSRMIEVLKYCGALAIILPEVDSLPTLSYKHTLHALDSRDNGSLSASLSLLLHGVGDDQACLVCERIEPPRAIKEVALLVAKWHRHIDQVLQMEAGEVLDLLLTLDAIRRPQRFAQILQISTIIYSSSYNSAVYQPAVFLQQTLECINNLPIKEMISHLNSKNGQRIAHMIYEQRLKAITSNVLQNNDKLSGVVK